MAQSPTEFDPICLQNMIMCSTQNISALLHTIFCIRRPSSAGLNGQPHTHTDLEDDGNRSRRSELKGSTCSSRQQPSADHSITYILEVASNSNLSPLLAKYPPIMKRNFTVNVPLKIARSKPPLTRPMNTPCKKATRNTPS